VVKNIGIETWFALPSLSFDVERVGFALPARLWRLWENWAALV